MAFPNRQLARGQPVAVEMNIEVAFILYSKPSHISLLANIEFFQTLLFRSLQML